MTLAILVTIAAVIWSAIAALGAMSSNGRRPGGASVIAAWLLVAAAWLIHFVP